MGAEVVNTQEQTNQEGTRWYEAFAQVAPSVNQFFSNVGQFAVGWRATKAGAGAYIDPEESNAPAPQKPAAQSAPKPLPWWAWLIIVFVVVIILFLIGWGIKKLK